VSEADRKRAKRAIIASKKTRRFAQPDPSAAKKRPHQDDDDKEKLEAAD
jgi:hypothetical protein